MSGNDCSVPGTLALPQLSLINGLVRELMDHDVDVRLRCDLFLLEGEEWCVVSDTPVASLTEHASSVFVSQHYPILFLV